MIATQATDADATAKSATGGLVEVNNYNTSATATPTVTINVNDCLSVVAGSTLPSGPINGRDHDADLRRNDPVRSTK